MYLSVLPSGSSCEDTLAVSTRTPPSAPHVRAATHHDQITGAVDAAGAEGVGDELGGGEVFPVQVPAREAHAADAELALLTQRALPEPVRLEDVQLCLGDGVTERQLLCRALHHAQAGGPHRRLRRAVRVAEAPEDGRRASEG
jgi:hypothetical protein